MNGIQVYRGIPFRSRRAYNEVYNQEPDVKRYHKERQQTVTYKRIAKINRAKRTLRTSDIRNYIRWLQS